MLKRKFTDAEISIIFKNIMAMPGMRTTDDADFSMQTVGDTIILQATSTKGVHDFHNTGVLVTFLQDQHASHKLLSMRSVSVPAFELTRWFLKPSLELTDEQYDIIGKAVMTIPGMRTDRDSDFVVEDTTEDRTYFKAMSDHGVNDRFNAETAVLWFMRQECPVMIHTERSFSVANTDLKRIWLQA